MNFSRAVNIMAIIFLLFGGCFIVFDLAQTAQENSSINVNYNVPSPPSHGGPSDSQPPVISNITVTSNYTTGTVEWDATDNDVISGCTFDYGLTEMYGQSAIPDEVNPVRYMVNLSNLTTGTPYFFKISCTDPKHNQGSATGTLLTQSLGYNGRLTILAKPEKRVPKTGGNLALNGTLRLYNAVTKQPVYSMGVVLNNFGSSTVQNSAIPTGNFEAVLKGESHLAKRIINISIQNGQDTVLDFSNSGGFYLLAGDVQGAGLKDNFVDILDISAEDIKFNSSNLVFDLNRDGIVDVLDVSAVLVNYNKGGDPV